MGGMLLRPSYRNTFLVVLVGLIVALTFSCYQGERYVGIYQSAEHPEIYIELKENGLGVWRQIDDEASFRWDVRDNEIRLHTKSGGVIIGKIKGDTLNIALPGRSNRHFKRAK